MDGLMMDTPLSLVHLFDRGTRLFADKEVVTASPAGVQRVTYGEWGERTRRLGGVLDYQQTVLVGRSADLRHIAQTPRKVDRQYRFRPGGYGVGEQFDVDVQILTDIDEYGFGPAKVYGIEGGDPGKRRSKHLVPRSDVEAAEGQV